jgi:hypothetical protein
MEEKPKPFDLTSIVVLVIIALLNDGLEIFFDLFAATGVGLAGEAIMEVIDFAVDGIVFVWFFMKTGGGAQSYTQVGAGFLESFGVPDRTIGVVIGILIANNPKAAKVAEVVVEQALIQGAAIATGGGAEVLEVGAVAEGAAATAETAGAVASAATAEGAAAGAATMEAATEGGEAAAQAASGAGAGSGGTITEGAGGGGSYGGEAGPGEGPTEDILESPEERDPTANIMQEELGEQPLAKSAFEDGEGAEEIDEAEDAASKESDERLRKKVSDILHKAADNNSSGQDSQEEEEEPEENLV